MIYKCSCCGKYVYPHDIEVDGICPFCGSTDLQITDEDEQ